MIPPLNPQTITTIERARSGDATARAALAARWSELEAMRVAGRLPACVISRDEHRLIQEYFGGSP